MRYLTRSAEIRSQIASFAAANVLWLDTEVADWNTPCPRLSIIQVLTNPTDTTGESAYILDVLDQPDLVIEFMTQVIAHPKIEKVFHNANYDLKFLGKAQAQNVTCTLNLAKKIGKEALGVTNLKLKTLAAELCQFTKVDIEEQGSDWGKRSLTPKQLQYAMMDVVYLAAVHRCLLEFFSQKTVTQGDMASPFVKKSTGQVDSTSLTATKVRIAFECPRLFYLNHHFAAKSLFLPPESAVGIGNAFHQLADALIRLAVEEPNFQKLFRGEPAQLSIEKIATEMQSLFYHHTFLPYLQQAVEKDESKAPALLQVWQGLQSLIKKFAKLLVENRSYCSPETLIQQTFVLEERQVQHQFILPDDTQQKVTGKFDCLIYNFKLKRFCVVEFKTYEPADPSAQLAQVALYSYLLWIKKQVPVDSAVYCVLPKFIEHYYLWEELETTVHQRIPHKLQQMKQWLTWEPPNPNPPPETTQVDRLCPICPQQEKCKKFFISSDRAGDSNPISPISAATAINSPVSVQEPFKRSTSDQTKPTIEPTAAVNADAMGQALVDTLRSFKIGATYEGAAIGPAFVRVKLKPEMGIKVNSILKLSDDLRVQLGLNYPPLIAPQAGFVSVDLPRPDRQTAHFDHYIQAQKSAPTEPVRIAIGIDLDGKLVEADLSDPNTCHFLVGGTTGSGKSEFLRSLLLSLIVRHDPQHLKIALVDPKRVTFPEFEKMPWLFSSIVKDSDRAIELMGELVDEMDSRYQQFEAAGCNDLKTYNQKLGIQSNRQLSRIVCIFDEYADFMAEKETRVALEQSIKRLGAMARAAGIHLIIATQRPEAKVVTPLIRSNLPGRVALRTASAADSEIVLGGKQTAAASLLGKGDLLYLGGANFLRLQSLFASEIRLPDKS